MRSTKINKSEDQVRSTADLAKRLNLSRWTISRVLNGHDGVNPNTVSRIQAAMVKYGFSPNALAQGLRTGRSNMVGVCLPEIERLYLGQKLEFLRQSLTANGYYMMIGMTNGNAQEELSTLSRFQELRAAGVILVASQIALDRNSLFRFMDKPTPVIQIDPMAEPSADSICVDRGAGMKQAMRHLFELGHRHISTLGFPADCQYSQQRLQGIMRTYKDQRLNPNKYLHSFALPSEKGSFYHRGHSAAAGFWKSCGAKRKAARPTAVLAYNDRVAIGFMDGLRELGVRVPNDLSVIGYDNMEVGEFVSPKLTTIDARPDELIRKATECLLQNIRGEKSIRKKVVRIPACLLPRGSTSPNGLN